VFRVGLGLFYPCLVDATLSGASLHQLGGNSFQHIIRLQDVDPDLEMLMQLPTPGSCSKGGSKRGCTYNHDKDIQLCVYWMNVSNDPIVGNDHVGKTYWTRIAIHYTVHS
jgi:hypothetical protein